MPAASRDFTITYGTITIGTGSVPPRPITGALRFEKTPEEFSLEFDFLIRADNAGLMLAEVQLVENAFAVPYQQFTLQIGTDDLNAQQYSYSSSGGVNQFGFDAIATLTKPGSPMDSALSRLYRAKIVFGLPANKLGTAAGRMGRRECKVSVAFTESRRRTITLSGTFTGVPDAGGAASARANYDKQIDAYASAVLSNIVGSTLFEVVGEPLTEIDDTVDGGSTGMGRVIRFVRTYQEIIYTQGGASGGSPVDDQRIVNQRVHYNRRREFQGLYAPEARPLEYIDIDYTASIRANALPGTSNPQQDVDYTRALQQLYTGGAAGGGIRAFIIREAMSIIGTSGIPSVVTFETVNFNYDDNTIHASMTIVAAPVGDIFEATLLIEDSYESGETLVPVWSGADPNFTKYRYPGPARRLRNITDTKRVKGRRDPNTGTADPIKLTDLPKSSGNAVILNYAITHSPIRMGAADLGAFQDFTDITIRYTLEFFQDPAKFGTTTTAPGPVGAPLDEVPGFASNRGAGVGGGVFSVNRAPGM